MNYLKECQENKLFWNAFPEFNGALTYESIDEKSRPYYEIPLLTIKSLLNHLRSIEEYADIDENLYIGYLCNNSRNAVVKKVNGNYFIGINSGLVDSIILAVNTIFSSENTFMNFGNPYVETNNQIILGSKKGNVLEIEKIISNGLKYSSRDLNNNFYNYQIDTWPTPVDYSRRAMAELIISYALEFIILHELAHILCGHVDYLIDNDFNYSFISNIPQNLNSRTNTRMSYWMESDADYMAMQIIDNSSLIFPERSRTKLDFYDEIRTNLTRDGEFKYLKILTKNFNIVNETTRMPLDYQRIRVPIDLKVINQLWSLAIQIVQYLFIQNNNFLNEWDSESHPHPTIRIMSLSPQFRLNLPNDVLDEYYTIPWLTALNNLSGLWEHFGIPGINSVIDLDKLGFIIGEFENYRRTVLSNNELVYNNLKDGGYRRSGEKIYSYLRKNEI